MCGHRRSDRLRSRRDAPVRSRLARSLGAGDPARERDPHRLDPVAAFLSGIAFGARPCWRSRSYCGASLGLATISPPTGPALRHRGRRRRGDPVELRHRPSARAASAHGDPRGLRELDLRQLGDRGHGTGDRRRWRGVAASIAFTAVLGVLVVLGLPLLVPLLGLSPMQYGVLAGLTVYAVPQVLAATAPVAALSVQVGTLVKLVRVLMLGPVVLMLSLGASRLREETDEAAPGVTAGDRPARAGLAIHAGAVVHPRLPGARGPRSAGLVPQVALAPMSETANVMNRGSMAALGLGVDVRSVAKAGARVTLAVVASLVALGAVSLGLIRVLGLA